MTILRYVPEPIKIILAILLFIVALMIGLKGGLVH